MIEYTLKDLSVNVTFKDDGLAALDNLLLTKDTFQLFALLLMAPLLSKQARLQKKS